MRLILSRKGFDTSAGGCPSPIFPDGTLYSLPIPDTQSGIAYGELRHSTINIGDLVGNLTRNAHRPEHFAHLDPDIRVEAYPRRDGWRPLLGQTGAAQGHLRKQKVQTGDLFLFFGLFRAVEMHENSWRFLRQAMARHALWGWLQIDKISKVDELGRSDLSWARYHPHFQTGPDTNNTLYIAADQVNLGGRKLDIPGAGVFPRIDDRLLLTAPRAESPTQWRLPRGFFPGQEKPPLSYHSRPTRWRRKGHYCYLNSVSRGQEFVLDTTLYPEVLDWVQDLLSIAAQAD